MSTAVWGFLGVVLGGVLTGTMSLWQVQLVTRREREAREALREQERRDRRDAFQRETILAVQDAVAEYWPTMTDAARLREQPAPSIWSPAARALHWRINMLRARIFDEELRQLVAELQGGIYRVVKAEDLDSIETYAIEADRLTKQMYNRMNLLLKDLF
jgi:hypothetical protein